MKEKVYQFKSDAGFIMWLKVPAKKRSKKSKKKNG